MADCVSYLHDEMRMTHNDLHNDQYIITQDGTISLLDFSMAKVMPLSGVVPPGGDD
jgi:aminoglycoside phosphotransferase (APT) family kinase protein